MTFQVPDEYAWVKDDVPVWYRPTLKSDKRYAGRVNGNPWVVGSTGETWVVHLDEMEPSYRNGQRSTVSAAYLGALEPREPEPARRPLVSFTRGKFTFWLHTLGNNGHPYATQEETTLQDLADALSDLEERGVYTPANHHVDAAIDKLEKILDSGEQHGRFGGEKIQAFAERLLQLGHLADPGFGVDPNDSNELCRLRQAIDDHLLWPSDAQREGGDYIAAVVHSGRLAQIMDRARKQFDAIFGPDALDQTQEESPP